MLIGLIFPALALLVHHSSVCAHCSGRCPQAFIQNYSTYHAAQLLVFCLALCKLCLSGSQGPTRALQLLLQQLPLMPGCAGSIVLQHSMCLSVFVCVRAR